MQIVSLAAIFVLLMTPGCLAAASATSQPSGLEVSIAIKNEAALKADITITNRTNHGIGVGRLMSYAVTRTDVSPAQVVLTSPPNEMHPHFRRLLQPGDSTTSTLALSEKPLPAGKYELAITFPADMFSEPVRKTFEITAATQP